MAHFQDGKNTIDLVCKRFKVLVDNLLLCRNMQKPELDHEHMAHAVRDKKLAGALFFFFLLLPLPALLVGHWQIAFFAVLLAFIYILLNPNLMMPSKAEIDVMVRAGAVAAVERKAAEAQLTAKAVLADRAGQPATVKNLDERVGKDKSPV